MNSEHVVEVEVTGFAAEGMVAGDGHRLTAKEARKANDEKRAAVEALDVELVDVLERADGTGIFYFRWDPEPETFVRERDQRETVDADDEPAHAAQTWHSAKLYTEHVISSVVGAGFAIVEKRIGTRAVEEADEAASDEAE